ncbi:hypothetical protein D9615_004800 [Tricholomella constricta]|uniref:cystathionine gamma-lyase n=1 Tax=Tricholomella constricta TaxID=117010 RepID=A0A8H5M799_9AGAR|nr:hypothetical protein D9615_004800 [Tricholomella constricta]
MALRLSLGPPYCLLPLLVLEIEMSPSVAEVANGTTPTNAVKKPSLGFGTRAIHVGSAPSKETGAVIPAISLSTTYKQDAIGVHKGFEYSRSGNPNRDAFETTLASLESGGAHGLAFSSGSSTTATVLQSLGPGAHMVSVNDVYGGTFRYMTRVATINQSLETTFLDLETADDATILASIRDNTKLIWIESPTNPTLRLIDIPRIASLAHSHPAHPLVLVDNTFLSPFYTSPLLLGADIVLHSLTKYVNGHSDVVMGALILPEHHAALAEKLRFLQNAIGAVPSPYDCWLAQRGAKTLHLRMKAHGTNALAIAKALERSPHVETVIYPGLASHPRNDLAYTSLSPHARKFVDGLVTRDADGNEVADGGFPYGGMISFRIRGGEREAERFLTATKLFTLAESLGGVESLAEHPARMTHGSIPEADRAILGIGGNLVRLSVGVEDVDDLVQDVEQALEIAFSARITEDCYATLCQYVTFPKLADTPSQTPFKLRPQSTMSYKRQRRDTAAADKYTVTPTPHTRDDAMVALRSLMKQYRVDPAMLEDDDSEPSEEVRVSEITYADVAPLVGLVHWNNLKDIGVFEIHRSRIPTDFFKSIVMDIDDMLMQYGPPPEHFSEEARSRFFSPVRKYSYSYSLGNLESSHHRNQQIFNHLIRQFSFMLRSDPETSIGGHFGTQGRKVGMQGRIEHLFKIFGAVAILFVEVKLKVRNEIERVEAIAQAIAECDSCDLNNNSSSRDFSLPIHCIFSDGESFEFFKFERKPNPSFLRGCFDGDPKHLRRGLQVPDFTTMETSLPFILQLRCICETIFDVMLSAYIAGLQAEYHLEEKRKKQFSERPSSSSHGLDRAIQSAQRALAVFREAEGQRKAGYLDSADATVEEALRALHESTGAVPSMYESTLIMRDWDANEVRRA